MSAVLNYVPLYISVYALQLVMLVGIALERMTGAQIPAFVVIWGAVMGAGLANGYANRRWSAASNQFVQLLPMPVALLAVFIWSVFVGPHMHYVVAGLGLLVARNFLLATRRALYLDLGIVLALFYDNIGAEGTEYLWPVAMAFLVALVFVLMADYADRRLSYVGAEAREALAPGVRNAAIATTLVLIFGALIYFLLPQPGPRGFGLPIPDAQHKVDVGAPTPEGKKSKGAREDPKGAPAPLAGKPAPGNLAMLDVSKSGPGTGEGQAKMPAKPDPKGTMKGTGGRAPEGSGGSFETGKQAGRMPATDGDPSASKPGPEDAFRGPGDRKPGDFGDGSGPKKQPERMPATDGEPPASGPGPEAAPRGPSDRKPGDFGEGGHRGDRPAPGEGKDEPQSQLAKADPGDRPAPAPEEGTDKGKGMPPAVSPSYDRPHDKSPAPKGSPGKKPQDIGKGKAPATPDDEGTPAARAGKPPPSREPLILAYVDAPRAYYARTHAYTRPLRGAWLESGDAPVALDGDRGRFLLAPAGERDAMVQKYRIVAELENRVPAAYRPARLSYPASRVSFDVDYTVTVREPLGEGLSYSVFSVVQHTDGRQAGEPEQRPRAQPYLTTAGRVGPAVRSLVHDIVGTKSAAIDRAVALEAYLRKNYEYGAFDSGADDPTEAFLFNHRRGDARQFASALALMLRTAGIPSRVVTGFRVRRLNPLHGEYEIWSADRHHWVEGYVNERWMTFEPSPWCKGSPEPKNAWEAAKAYVETAKVDDRGQPRPGESRPPDEYLQRVLIWGWLATYGPWLLLVLVLLALLVWRQRRWLRGLFDAIDRMRLSHGGDPRERVLHAYRIAERAFQRRGAPRGRAENHAEYLSRMAAARPHVAGLLVAISGAFGTVRYGGGATSVETADIAVRACRELLELIDELKPA